MLQETFDQVHSGVGGEMKHQELVPSPLCYAAVNIRVQQGAAPVVGLDQSSCMTTSFVVTESDLVPLGAQEPPIYFKGG